MAICVNKIGRSLNRTTWTITT